MVLTLAFAGVQYLTDVIEKKKNENSLCIPLRMGGLNNFVRCLLSVVRSRLEGISVWGGG